MNKWKELRIEGTRSIEKCIIEYEVWEETKTPWSAFRVKIFEQQAGGFYGFTNLMVRNEQGIFERGNVRGMTCDRAFKDTLRDFFRKLERKPHWDNDLDFAYYEDITPHHNAKIIETEIEKALREKTSPPQPIYKAYDSYFIRVCQVKCVSFL